MTLKEYIIMIIEIIPIIMGVYIYALIASPFIHTELQGWITTSIFAIIYCFPVIKYLEKISK